MVFLGLAVSLGLSIRQCYLNKAWPYFLAREARYRNHLLFSSFHYLSSQNHFVFVIFLYGLIEQCYRVDEKYATVSVHYQNKKFLGNPFYEFKL